PCATLVRSDGCRAATRTGGSADLATAALSTAARQRVNGTHEPVIQTLAAIRVSEVRQEYRLLADVSRVKPHGHSPARELTAPCVNAISAARTAGRSVASSAAMMARRVPVRRAERFGSRVRMKPSRSRAALRWIVLAMVPNLRW